MSHLGENSQPLQTATMQSAAPVVAPKVWMAPVDAARYGGWGYRTFWRKVKAGLPVYYATDGTPTVYRQDLDAFQLGVSSVEMPSRSLRLRLRCRAAA